MAVGFRCSLCERDLKAHCPEGRCHWWRCTNRACDAATYDLGRGLRVSRAIEAGNLSVNSHSSVRYWTPFGGYKQSGLGRELGPDAPVAFTETKNVFIAH